MNEFVNTVDLKGAHTHYRWLDNWAGLNGAGVHSHGGIAQDRAGRIYISFNSPPYVRIFDTDGHQVGALHLSGENIHWLTISRDEEGEWIWDLNLARQTIGKYRLNGERVHGIGCEAFKVNDEDRLMFTSLSVDPKTHQVWVSDGYGHASAGKSGGNRIYCFDKNLELQFSFDGSESACGGFLEPHAVFVDTRKAESEIYITDRRNHRVVIYDHHGKYLRCIEKGLHTPSAISSFGDMLVVAELEGRVHLLDKDDRIVDTLGDGSCYVQRKGWPNRMEGEKKVAPHRDIEAGKFNSPHGVLADSRGDIYVHEWLLGVRLTKLARV